MQPIFCFLSDRTTILSLDDSSSTPPPFMFTLAVLQIGFSPLFFGLPLLIIGYADDLTAAT